MAKKLDYSFLDEAADMPALKHSKGQPFDITESEAAEWLVQLPAVKQKVFDMARYKGLITYDPVTQTWSGCDAR